MDVEGSVSMVLQDVLRILLRNVQPSLPPELIALILSFLPKPESRRTRRGGQSWGGRSQNPSLCQANEELWQMEWLTSLAKVNRELDEILRPLIWTNVAIYCDAQVARVALIKRLRQHLEQESINRRSIRRVTLDLTVQHDYLVRLGYPFDNIEEFVADTMNIGWPFESIEAYEEECIRLASIFPEHLRALQVNCGQLRLPSSAWSHIANRCPSLVVLRVDASAEDHAFRKNLGFTHEDDGPQECCYPREDDAFHLVRQVRGVGLGCGPEVPSLWGQSKRFGCDDLETIAIEVPNLTEWLQNNPGMLWVRLAAPEISWQPSLFGVWARLLGLATAPLARRTDDAFVIGSHDHGGFSEFDVLFDTAAMALRPHLDALTSRNVEITADTVLSMISTEPELVAWRWRRHSPYLNGEDLVVPFFTSDTYQDSSTKERNRVDAIVAGYLDTKEARRQGRELGCPFEGPEYMEENTVEMARAHLLKELPESEFGKEVLQRLAAMSTSFAESARKAKRIE